MNALKNLVSFGNNKLPKTTVIFNLGSATNCPSKKLGLCLCSSKCYAMKAEKLYPQVFPYRERQADYWHNTCKEAIFSDLSAIISKKRIKIDKLRLNEAGDFTCQADIDKMDWIAGKLFEQFQIVTYTYSARADLNFSACKFLRVKTSGYDNGNNGKTMVLLKGMQKPDNFITCPGDCKKCAICSSDKKINVAFPVH
jgi:hypothetical protein